MGLFEKRSISRGSSRLYYDSKVTLPIIKVLGLRDDKGCMAIQKAFSIRRLGGLFCNDGTKFLNKDMPIMCISRDEEMQLTAKAENRSS